LRRKKKLRSRSKCDALISDILVRVLVLNVVCGLLVTAERVCAHEFETPPVLKTSEVLTSEMQRDDSFVVQKQVRHDGFMNYYVVDSDFGQFEAYVDPALAKLIQEIRGVARKRGRSGGMGLRIVGSTSHTEA